MKRQLDDVLATFGEGAFDIRWRPYQLYPGVPADGVDRHEYLAGRYGRGADAARIPKGIQMAASEMGIALDFRAMKRIPNTLKAHCLMERAHELGCGHELAELLFEQHFCRGADVGDVDTLVAIASRVGIDHDDARASLCCPEAESRVRADLTRARDLEMSGVPCLLIEERFRIPGAQGVETLGQLLSRARERL